MHVLREVQLYVHQQVQIGVHNIIDLLKVVVEVQAHIVDLLQVVKVEVILLRQEHRQEAIVLRQEVVQVIEVLAQVLLVEVIVVGVPVGVQVEAVVVERNNYILRYGFIIIGSCSRL